MCQIKEVIADYHAAEARAESFLALVDGLIAWLSDVLSGRIDQLLRMSDDVSVEFGEAARDFDAAYLSFREIKDVAATKTRELAPARPHLTMLGCCLTWLNRKLVS
jgi:hypothetical protein